MKQREEIRYYALKTTAATGPFIISAIFIIKNSSQWERAEYSPGSGTLSPVRSEVCADHSCNAAADTANLQDTSCEYCLALSLSHTHTLKRSCGSRRFTQPRHSWDEYLQLLWWEPVFLEKFVIYIELKAIIFYVSKTNGRSFMTDMM